MWTIAFICQRIVDTISLERESFWFTFEWKNAVLPQKRTKRFDFYWDFFLVSFFALWPPVLWPSLLSVIRNLAFVWSSKIQCWKQFWKIESKKYSIPDFKQLKLQRKTFATEQMRTHTHKRQQDQQNVNITSLFISIHLSSI